MTTVEEARFGRNFIRAGDHVRVTPSARGKRDGYEARVRSIVVDESGEVQWLELVNLARNDLRSIRPARIRRMAQTRVHASREVRT